MERLGESDVVRIVRIHGPGEAHVIVDEDDNDDPDELNPWRMPEIGDTGRVLLLLAAGGRGLGNPESPGTRYIVEGVVSDGRTEWVAEFARDELELVRRSPAVE